MDSKDSSTAAETDDLIRLVEEDRAESAASAEGRAMKDDRDDRILWLATLLCRPSWRDAFNVASVRTARVADFNAAADLRAAGTILVDERSLILTGFADRVRVADPVLSLAWQLLALRTDDERTVIHATVAGAIEVLMSAEGDTRQSRARLRVWNDVAIGKYDARAYGNDFFDIAFRYWGAEMQRIVQMRTATSAEQHPALDVLALGRWNDAFGALHARVDRMFGEARAQRLFDVVADRKSMQDEITTLIEELYAVSSPGAGALALAWSMLTCDPRKPASFHHVLPQLQFALDEADLDADTDAYLRQRMRCWWRAAEGEYKTSKVSIFRLADPEAECWPDPPELQPHGISTSTSKTRFADIGLPTLVVMPRDKSSKLNNYHGAFKDLVDAAMPLVVVRDLHGIRAALHAEFPHAVTAVDLMLRDLREDKPTRLRPLVLVGSPGAGKSRLVRRLADLVSLYVYRFDGAASSDNQFAGTAKAWANTEVSVPVRAVTQSRTANPMVLIDEIEKAADRHHNGRLWDALLPFLDPETAGRYRDQSLDSELDLSMISYVATANDVLKLPSPLRDRFRIIRVPTPTLQHLPALASSVMRDLAAEDEARAGDEPLAEDELDVIGKAWARAGFSMRSLQKIVGASLEARDQHARRH